MFKCISVWWLTQKCFRLQQNNMSCNTSFSKSITYYLAIKTTFGSGPVLRRGGLITEVCLPTSVDIHIIVRIRYIICFKPIRYLTCYFSGFNNEWSLLIMYFKVYVCYVRFVIVYRFYIYCLIKILRKIQTAIYYHTSITIW